jgi:peptidoglycan/LPS O-acetylase OafA/YrhL
VRLFFDSLVARRGNSKSAVCAMNKTIGLQLVVYSLLLAGLSYLTHHLAPTVARPTLVAGLAGGALCLLWGFRAIAGSSGKTLPILTLIPICFVMLSQTVMNWGEHELPGGKSATAITAILLILSLGMLVRIAYAGVVFGGRLAIPSENRASTPPTPRKPANQAGKGIHHV